MRVHRALGPAILRVIDAQEPQLRVFFGGARLAVTPTLCEQRLKTRKALEHVSTMQRSKLSHGHHAAMPYADVPAFVAQLRAMDTIGALALEVVILTATRIGETLGCRFGEFDLANRMWSIPAERTKTRTQHRVPLSGRAAAIVASLQEASINEHVFPGRFGNTPSAATALLGRLTRRVKKPGAFLAKSPRAAIQQARRRPRARP